MNVTDEKSVLRRKFSALRKAIPQQEREKYDRAICRNISALPSFRAASHIAAYISSGSEVDLSALFYGKTLLLPRFNSAAGCYEMVAVDDIKRDLLPGKYSIPEPRAELPAVSPDLVTSRVLFLVPAVACDRYGCRLGRGGGYYDRLLDGVKIPPVAAIFSCQLSETALPGDVHDVRMGTIVTELEVVEVC